MQPTDIVAIEPIMFKLKYFARLTISKLRHPQGEYGLFHLSSFGNMTNEYFEDDLYIVRQSRF